MNRLSQLILAIVVIGLTATLAAASPPPPPPPTPPPPVRHMPATPRLIVPIAPRTIGPAIVVQPTIVFRPIIPVVPVRQLYTVYYRYTPYEPWVLFSSTYSLSRAIDMDEMLQFVYGLESIVR
jgi:hypothetical protein